MSMQSSEPLRFSIGAALSLSFREFTRRFGHYTLMVILLSLPGLALNIWMPVNTNFGPAGPTPEEVAALAPAIGAAILVGALASVIMLGALTFSVVSGLRGVDLSLGQCLSEGVGQMLKLIVLFVVLFLIAIVAMVILSVVSVLLHPLVGGTLMAALGVIAVLYLYVVAQVAAAESAWPITAISRSGFLTSGRRLEIFGLLLVQLLIALGVFVVLAIVAGLAAAVFFDVSEFPANPDPATLAPITAVATILLAPFSAFFAIIPPTAYFLLSVEKDGRDPGRVAELFD